MKKFLFLTLAFATAQTAQAGSLNMDFRFDMNSTTFNKEAALPNFQKYYIKTGRLDYKGQLNPDVDFRARLSFNKDAGSIVKRDTSTAAVEYAYVSNKFNDNFRLTFGKMGSGMGGFEAGTPSPDLYLTSENYTRSALARAGGRTLTSNAFLYVSGVKATISYAGHNLNLIESNNTTDSEDATASKNFNQNRGLHGVTWDSTFMDKNLKALVSYYEANPQTATGDSGNRQRFATVGFQSKFSSILFDGEYQTADYTDGLTTKMDYLNSFVFKLGYTGIENWIPRLEYTSTEDKREITAVTTDRYTGLGAVVEYVPEKDQTFRYHVAYSNLTQNPHTGADKMREEIVVGVRMLADFLK